MNNVKILQRVEVVEKDIGYGQVPVVEPTCSTGGMLGLLKELEALPQGRTIQDGDISSPKEARSKEVLRITLSEPTTESFPAVEDGSWEKVYGSARKESAPPEQSSMGEKLRVEDADIVISPSRFSPLMGIDEEVADHDDKEGENDVEEGEITGEAGSAKPHLATGTKKTAATLHHKALKQRIVRAKDLKFVGRQSNPKKTSVRKL